MTSEVGSWLSVNADAVYARLEAHRQHLRDKSSGQELLDLDLANRALSEMDLCVAMVGMELPEGYEVQSQTGRVKIPGDREHFHIFATKGDDILCLNPGWVEVINDPNVKPGDAVRRLIARAPDLFTIAGDVIALNGNAQDIKTRLGLEYTWKR